MSFILCAFFHGRNVTGCEYSAKNYTQSPSTSFSLSPLSALYSILSLPHHTSDSISLCPWLCGSQLRIVQSCMCVCLYPNCACVCYYLRCSKHNMLVSFIANTYFTTFPALELEEDQTSSIVNFLPEHNLESMPHRKPYTSTHTEGGMEKEGRESIIYHKHKWRFSFQQRIFTILTPSQIQGFQSRNGCFKGYL